MLPVFRLLDKQSSTVLEGFSALLIAEVTSSPATTTW
jgi:hypothetical protein